MQHDQNDEPVGNWRSFDLREGVDRWGTTTRSPSESGGVGGGGRSGKENAVNAGDLLGQETERFPAEVRAAIVAQASHGEPGETGATERNRVTSGGAKGGRMSEPKVVNDVVKRIGQQASFTRVEEDDRQHRDLPQRRHFKALNGNPLAWVQGVRAVNPEAYHYWHRAILLGSTKTL